MRRVDDCDLLAPRLLPDLHSSVPRRPVACYPQTRSLVMAPFGRLAGGGLGTHVRPPECLGIDAVDKHAFAVQRAAALRVDAFRALGAAHLSGQLPWHGPLPYSLIPCGEAR